LKRKNNEKPGFLKEDMIHLKVLQTLPVLIGLNSAKSKKKKKKGIIIEPP
jgi:hypothetical protein